MFSYRVGMIWCGFAGSVSDTPYAGGLDCNSAAAGLLFTADAGILLGGKSQGVRERTPRGQLTSAGTADMRVAAGESLHR